MGASANLRGDRMKTAFESAYEFLREDAKIYLDVAKRKIPWTIQERQEEMLRLRELGLTRPLPPEPTTEDEHTVPF